MKPLLRVGIVLLCASGPVFGDTISLKNGRRIECHVLSQTSRAVRIEVPGGQMDLPRSQIASIEESLSVEDEYALRYQRTALDDPDALEALAAWARKHELEPRAHFLEDQARGVRLEKRFAHAKTASELLEVGAWARSQGFARDVQRLAAKKALEVDPGSVAARHELEAIDREEELEARATELERERKLEEREKAVQDRERWIAARERQLRERRAQPPVETPPPETHEPAATADDATTPRPRSGIPDVDELPPGTSVLIFRRPHPKDEDDPLNPKHARPEPPASGGSAPTPAPHANPLPAAPRLPATPGFASPSP